MAPLTSKVAAMSSTVEHISLLHRTLIFTNGSLSFPDSFTSDIYKTLNMDSKGLPNKYVLLSLANQGVQL
jgi:hypothetical protein